MFGNLDTSSIPTIDSYGKAVLFYQRVKPWRGSGDTNLRPMHKSRRRHMTMRKANDGSIVFTLYNTDVVTWHPDNSITVKPYPSTTTDKFANAVLPDGVYPRFNGALGSSLYMRHAGHDVMIGDIARLRQMDDKWYVVDGVKPITVPVLDKQKAREACVASRLNDFLVWSKAFEAMQSAPRKYDYFWPRNEDVLAMLTAGSEEWIKLYDKCNYSMHSRLGMLRQIVYAAHECVDMSTQEAVFPNHTYMSAVRARRTYRMSIYGY